MPKLHTKESVLDGRGHIVSYENNPKAFYYRELIEGTKTYRSKKIEGVDNVEDGKKKVLDIVLELSGKLTNPNSKQKAIEKKLRTQDIELAVNNFIKHEEERMNSEIIGFKTFCGKKWCLNKHLLPYLKMKGVTKTRQINDDTFEDYLIFRRGAKKLTINNEIQIIRNFLSEWLVKKRLVDPEVVSNRRLFPLVKVRMTDLMANPAISAKDWMLINKQIRTWVKAGTNIVNHRVHLWRTIFWNFTLISKNSGCRPEELMKLRWRDVDVIDVGRISESKRQEEIEEFIREGFDVLDDPSRNLGGWAESPEAFGRESRLVAYITVTSGKTGQIREVPTNAGNAFVRLKDYLNTYYKEHFKDREVTGNDLVFGNIHNETRPYDYSMFGKSWKATVDKLKNELEGHRFSNEIYTIYSMRSTFIENKLLAGLDLFLLSRITGHDVKILLKHYERLDIRKRSEEITTIDYGKGNKESLKVELFAN